MSSIRVGYALCGSFCTFEKSIAQMEKLASMNYEIIPIMSYNAFNTDTRFGKAEDIRRRIENICDRPVISPKRYHSYDQRCRTHRSQKTHGYHGGIPMYRKHGCQACRSRHRHARYHGGKVSPASVKTGAAQHCDKRCSRCLCTEYRQAAEYAAFLFCTVLAGRPLTEAQLSGCRF